MLSTGSRLRLLLPQLFSRKCVYLLDYGSGYVADGIQEFDLLVHVAARVCVTAVHRVHLARIIK